MDNVLDQVNNHSSPSPNYLTFFGTYFTNPGTTFQDNSCRSVVEYKTVDSIYLIGSWEPTLMSPSLCRPTPPNSLGQQFFFTSQTLASLRTFSPSKRYTFNISPPSPNTEEWIYSQTSITAPSPSLKTLATSFIKQVVALMGPDPLYTPTLLYQGRTPRCSCRLSPSTHSGPSPPSSCPPTKAHSTHPHPYFSSSSEGSQGLFHYSCRLKSTPAHSPNLAKDNHYHQNVSQS